MPAQSNQLRELLDSDEPTIGTRLMCSWPGMVEVLGQTNSFDYIEFLGEYAPWNLHDLENFARAAEIAGLSSMMKVDSANREFIAQRSMASGIGNILFADISDAEEARECVEIVRAPPNGKNSIRMDRRNGYIGGYASPTDVVDFCEEAVVAIMVENESCVERLEEILAVEGIDMVQFGPADYSLSIGHPEARGSDAVISAEEETIETALDMGVHARAEINTPAEAEWYLERGVTDFNLNTDIRVLYHWWSDKGSELEDIVQA